jgi:very-short-patch-repair endonuclease
MQGITNYTDKQKEVEKWINQIGFRTELESVFGKYCADIYIPELNWIVEVDGPSHYKKRDNKRDTELREEHKIENIMHVKVEIKESDFKPTFVDAVKSYYGDEFEKRT